MPAVAPPVACSRGRGNRLRLLPMMWADLTTPVTTTHPETASTASVDANRQNVAEAYFRSVTIRETLRTRPAGGSYLAIAQWGRDVGLNATRVGKLKLSR